MNDQSPRSGNEPVTSVARRDSVRAHDLYASAPEPKPSNRRRHQRVELETEVTFTDHTNFYTGFTEDLSEGGLFVATYALEPLGTKISLKLTLPDEREVEVTGTVRWLRDPRDHDADAPPGMGIQFDDVASTDLDAIREFVALRAPLFYED